MNAPTIHNNGTSRKSLVDAFCEAYQAVDTAYQAVKQTAPNYRDYYLQGPEAITAATVEHTARLRKLDEVKAELEALAIRCDAE